DAHHALHAAPGLLGLHLVVVARAGRFYGGHDGDRVAIGTVPPLAVDVLSRQARTDDLRCAKAPLPVLRLGAGLAAAATATGAAVADSTSGTTVQPWRRSASAACGLAEIVLPPRVNVMMLILSEPRNEQH